MASPFLAGPGLWPIAGRPAETVGARHSDDTRQRAPAPGRTARSRLLNASRSCCPSAGFRGVSAEQDSRFANKEKKLIKASFWASGWNRA